MQTDIIDFGAKKRSLDTTVIYPGDSVEWQDYDGETYEGSVFKIEFKSVDNTNLGGDVKALPLWEKDEYVVYLGEGFSIAGNSLLRKISKRKSNRPRGY